MLDNFTSTNRIMSDDRFLGGLVWIVLIVIGAAIFTLIGNLLPEPKDEKAIALRSLKMYATFALLTLAYGFSAYYDWPDIYHQTARSWPRPSVLIACITISSLAFIWIAEEYWKIKRERINPLTKSANPVIIALAVIAAIALATMTILRELQNY